VFLVPFLIKSSLKGRTCLWFYTICRIAQRPEKTSAKMWERH